MIRHHVPTTSSIVAHPQSHLPQRSTPWPRGVVAVPHSIRRDGLPDPRHRGFRLLCGPLRLCELCVERGKRRARRGAKGRRGRLTDLLSVWLLAAATLSADSLEDRLQPLIASHAGKVAVAVKNLESGEAYSHQAEHPMPTASLIKFPIMIEVYRQAEAGEVDLDRTVILRESDKVPGSGILTAHFSPGAQFSLRDAVRLMIAFSDNTATNLVIDQIGLPATSETMTQMGCQNTKLHAKVFRRDTSIFPDRSEQFGLGSTTASEMLRLLEMLAAGKLVSADASQKMREHLLACDDRSKIARFLPADTKFAHKTGAVSQSRCDAGLLETPAGQVAMCVLTTDNEDRRWSDDNAAEVFCGRVGQVVYDYFQAETAEPESEHRIRLVMGSHGALVEDLQRTLNARLDPSPELTPDGDFGPMTEAAVVRFQKASGLEAHGEVDAATWKALSPLETTDAPVPDPTTVNAEVLPKQPADSRTGPPFVTCKAWGIADPQTGDLLWSHNEKERLDPASTTKIMTAVVALTIAQENPDVLKERIVFSERADQTTGSSCGLRPGEMLTVDELLYGLLLPSGNDASVALGEQMGRHVEASDPPAEAADLLARFIARMNRTAQDLGLQETVYRNTHGMTDPDHLTSVRDLAHLAAYAMKLPRFREIVGTPRRGCTVESTAGYRRNVLWKNTNRLLGIEGYHGIKTGTTNAAGACLVSYGSRSDQNLIVVVLGSTSSDARYTDTRNLFRWGWQQRLSVDE